MNNYPYYPINRAFISNASPNSEGEKNLLQMMIGKSATVCFLLCFLSLSLTGCMNLKAYVDPTLEKIDQAKLRAVPDAQKVNVYVIAEFQRNGKPFDAVTGDLRKQVTSVLNKSGMFLFVSTGNVPGCAKFNIIMDNMDGSQKGSGYTTGFTFGLVGAATTDPYHVTISWTAPGKELVTKEYNHAIHCTLGAKSAPSNLKPMTVDEAFNQVVKEVVLLFLHDLQSDGQL